MYTKLLEVTKAALVVFKAEMAVAASEHVSAQEAIDSYTISRDAAAAMMTTLKERVDAAEIFLVSLPEAPPAAYVEPVSSFRNKPLPAAVPAKSGLSKYRRQEPASGVVRPAASTRAPEDPSNPYANLTIRESAILVLTGARGKEKTAPEIAATISRKEGRFGKQLAKNIVTALTAESKKSNSKLKRRKMGNRVLWQVITG